jgi:hypothetical protein
MIPLLGAKARLPREASDIGVLALTKTSDNGLKPTPVMLTAGEDPNCKEPEFKLSN